MSLREEIQPGLVLHLDPNVLVENGATFTSSKARRVLEKHFFLCLSTTEGEGRWVPLYSDDKAGDRVVIGTEGKHGHAKWTARPSYAHAAQVWTASHDAVVLAAAAGGDRSTEGARNSVEVAKLPKGL